jgi:hypothetical protein
VPVALLILESSHVRCHWEQLRRSSPEGCREVRCWEALCLELLYFSETLVQASELFLEEV